MPNTFRLISTTTVGSGGAASIDFTSIPQTYEDLQLVFSLRGNGSDPNCELKITINGNGGVDRVLYAFGTGGGGSNSSGSNIRGAASGNTATANMFGSGNLYIPNYTVSGAKIISMETSSEGNANNHAIYMTGAKTADTSAVTSVSIIGLGGSWMQYSSASLYGILKGSGGATVA